MSVFQSEKIKYVEMSCMNISFNFLLSMRFLCRMNFEGNEKCRFLASTLQMQIRCKIDEVGTK